MIKLILNHKDLIRQEVPQKMNLIETYDMNIVRYCIDMFHTDVKWDGMFTADDAEERFRNGYKLYVAYYDNNIFGYCWLAPTEIGVRIVNLFCKKTNSLKRYGAVHLLYLMLSKYAYGIITAEADDWNTASIRSAELNGMRRMD